MCVSIPEHGEAEVMEARRIPETLGKSKIAFSSHGDPDIPLNVKWCWLASLPLCPSQNYQRDQLILEVRGQGACSEEEFPRPAPHPWISCSCWAGRPGCMHPQCFRAQALLMA